MLLVPGSSKAVDRAESDDLATVELRRWLDCLVDSLLPRALERVNCGASVEWVPHNQIEDWIDARAEVLEKCTYGVFDLAEAK